MKKIFFPLLVIFVFGVGCRKEILPIKPGENVFTIRAGNHDADGLRVAVAGSHSVLRFEATLYNNTAPGSVSEIPSYNQVNKLFGFNDCKGLQGNHENSARIGWYFHEVKEPNPNALNTSHLGDGKTYVMDVLGYTYVNGVRTYDTENPLASIQLGIPYRYEIQIIGDEYKMSISDRNGTLINSVTMKRGCSGSGSFTIINYPYFGGESPAPHTMQIGVKLL